MAFEYRLGPLAAAALLVLAVPAAGAETKPTSPVSPAAAGQPASAAVAKARQLIRAHRYGEALTLLRSLIGAETVDADAFFLLGMAAMEASRRPGLSEGEREVLLDASVTAFRIMLIERPDLVRVRLELARAFFYQGEDALAREHFERVLAGDLPPAIVANVRQFLAQIRAKRRWRIYFGAAIAPDSNIGSGSEAEFIEIFGLPFRRDADDLTTSGVGLSTWFGGEYQHPLGDRFRLRAGGDVSRREYASSEFDQTSLSVHLGPRWFAGPLTEVSFLGSANRRLVASTSDYDELGIRVEASRRMSSRVVGDARVSWHDRRYRTGGRLDGPVRDLSVGANWVLTPALRMNGRLGYSNERPERVSNRNATRWFRVGAQWALPRGFSLGGRAQIRWTDYDGVQFPPTIDGLDREDRTRTLSASVHHRRFTLYGFSPKLTVTNETRSTNAQALDYRRNRAEVSFTRQF